MTSSTSLVPSNGPPRRTNPSFASAFMNDACAAQAAWLSIGRDSCQAGPRVRITANSDVSLSSSPEQLELELFIGSQALVLDVERGIGGDPERFPADPDGKRLGRLDGIR